MTRFEEMIKERAGSKIWSSEIARKVLNKQASRLRKLRLIYSAAASIAVIAGAGLFYQINQKPSLKSSFDYVLSETISGSGENTVISSEMDSKIIQYCMNTK